MCVMSKTISSLPSVLIRHRWPAIATFVSVVGGSLAYLAVAPRMYVTSARLMLDDKRVSVSELGRDITQLPSGTPGGPSPIASQAELVKSQRVLKRALAKAFPQGANTPESIKAAGELSSGLKVKIVPATNILELSYQNRDPVLAAKLLNAVADAMVEENEETIRLQAHSVRTFLADEVPKQIEKLNKAEAAEDQYRQASGVISLEDQTKSLVDSLATLEEQERTLSAELQEAKSRDASLRQVTDAETPKDAYAGARIGQDDALKQLRTKLAELDAKVVEMRSHFKENVPTLQSLIDQRDAMLALYRQQSALISPNGQDLPPSKIASDDVSKDLASKFISNDIDRVALENKLNIVRTERVNLQNRLTELPIKQQPLTTLTRRREEAEASLKLLQTKLEEARIAENQLISNIQIIGQAQLPLLPQSPKRSVVLLGGTVFGIILAMGVVLLLEVTDNTLRDASEAEELLKLPVLGVLPTLPAAALKLGQPDSFLDNVGLVEPYRTLLKALNRSSQKVKLVVVSSTLSGEGKSAVVSHLAAVSAMLGRRTLIIDADLRRPTQDRLFNLPAHSGMTDAIEGYKSLLQVVQQTDVENLSVLTCGELHTRPSQLIESAAMEALLAEAAAHYDLVIVDTPPVSSCADAATLSSYSDGLLLITRPNFTPREMLLQAVSHLKSNRVPILGVVANGMTNQTKKYDRYPVKGYQPISKSLKRLAYLKPDAKSSVTGLRSNR